MARRAPGIGIACCPAEPVAVVNFQAPGCHLDLFIPARTTPRAEVAVLPARLGAVPAEAARTALDGRPFGELMLVDGPIALGRGAGK